MELQVGSTAPEFSLRDQNGANHSLSQYKGKWVLLYFYPKDDTPGCTKEACGFRDAFTKFAKNNIVVLGMSKDSVESHKKFAEKYKLQFPLLADLDGMVLEKYGAWGEKNMMGKTYMGILRISFLIDPEGRIRKVYDKVKPELHAQEILEDVAAL